MYIDDEDPNLVAFRAIFRREYNVITASSADDALTLLNQNANIKVIISDQRMQGKTGIEFFESILENYPDPVRIILTGFADQKAMIDSINRARVFRFLSKPWNEYDLRQTIISAIELYDARNNLHVKQKKVEENLEQLNGFIHSASNEMRSTLVSMHGILKLIMNGGDKIDATEYYPLIEKGVIRIDLQLRSIIDHYNNNRFLSEYEEIHLDKIIEKSKESLSTFLDLSQLHTRISNPDNVSVYTNEYKVQLLFYNLISFALNNQNPDNAGLNVDIELSNEKNGVQIVFTDNGKVIDSDLSESIFDALVSGKGKDKLTLYLVKEAIDGLQGTLYIDSVPRAGTSYTIFIPNKSTKNESGTY